MNKYRRLKLAARYGHRRGATTVELAIVLPTTILLLIGLCVAELGAFRYQHIAALAHESARWASVHGKEYARQSGGNIATREDIYKNVIKPRAVGLDVNNINYEVQWDADKNVVTVSIQYIWTPEAFFAPRKLSCTAIALATY